MSKFISEVLSFNKSHSQLLHKKESHFQ